jgi:hypothetical protein
MKPIYLDGALDSITVVMAAAAQTTNPDWTTHYHDNTQLGNDYASSDGTLNGTTPVTLVATAASLSQTRIVDEIIIQNRDSAPVTITIRFVSGTGTRQLWSGTLQAGDTWSLAEGVRDTNGNIKIVQGIATPYPPMANRIPAGNITVPAGYSITVPVFYLLNSGINILLSAGADMRID